MNARLCHVIGMNPKVSAVMPRATTSRSENLETTPQRGTFQFINMILGEILADSVNSDEICNEVVHKQCEGN